MKSTLRNKGKLLGKLERLIGKYVLACTSDDNSLLTEEIEMSVPIQECTFHLTCTMRTEMMYLCLAQLLYL